MLLVLTVASIVMIIVEDILAAKLEVKTYFAKETTKLSLVGNR